MVETCVLDIYIIGHIYIDVLDVWDSVYVLHSCSCCSVPNVMPYHLIWQFPSWEVPSVSVHWSTGKVSCHREKCQTTWVYALVWLYYWQGSKSYQRWSEETVYRSSSQNRCWLGMSPNACLQCVERVKSKTKKL